MSDSITKQVFFACPSFNERNEPCKYVARGFSLSKAMWVFKRHFTEGKRERCLMNPDPSKFPWNCPSCDIECATAVDLKNHLISIHRYVCHFICLSSIAMNLIL